MAHETFVLCDAVDADGNRCPSRQVLDRRLGASLPAGWSTLDTSYLEQNPHFGGCGSSFSLKDMLAMPAFERLMALSKEKSPESAQVVDELVQAAADMQPAAPEPMPMVYSRRSTICDKHPLPKVMTDGGCPVPTSIFPMGSID